MVEQNVNCNEVDSLESLVGKICAGITLDVRTFGIMNKRESIEYLLEAC